MKKFISLLFILLLVSFAVTGCSRSVKVISSPTPKAVFSTSRPLSSKSYGYDRESTWGDLFDRYGMVWDTLTPAQQKLVHYPKLNTSKVYYTPNGTAYHAVTWCYTLSKSKTINSTTLYTARYSKYLGACSKCVDPDQIP